MTPLVVSSFVAAAVSLLLTPLVRRLAWRWKALDRADGDRKLQTGPVPYTGGLALMAALVVGTLIGCQDSMREPLAMPFPLALLLSVGTMCLVGWFDDRFHLRVRWKLLGQVLATLPLVFGGHLLERIEFAGFVCDLGWWTVPISIGWFVAGANALNFIDGADGLAATVGLVMAAAAALIAEQLGHGDVAILAAVLGAGLAGFLLYNWQPATIYLGDSGSMTVGLWLAALAVGGSHTPELGTRLVTLAGLFAVPLADLSLAVVRRQLSGLPFWIADRAHIHHRLFDRGFTVPQIAGTFAGFSAAAAAVAFAGAVHGRELLAWSSLVALALAARYFELAGSYELELARRCTVRWLVDLLAVVSLGIQARKCPRPDHLDRLSVAETWASFLAQMEQYEVADIEIALAGHAAVTQYQWRSPLVPFGNAAWYAVEIEFHAAGGKSCRLRAALRGDASAMSLQGLLLARVMRTYAEHWAKHADALSASLCQETSRNLTTAAAVGDDVPKAA